MDNRTLHLTDEEQARYSSKKMSPAELLAADNHLAACDLCHGRMASSAGLADRLQAASKAFDAAADFEVEHLSYDQMAALVDNQLNEIDREIVESHLEMCSRCEAELSDLRQVSSRMAAGQTVQYSPVPRPSLREKLLAFWRLPAWGLPALAAIGGVAVLAFLFSIPVRNENSRLRSKVAELERSNEELKEKAAVVERLESEVAELRDENDRLQQKASGQLLAALDDGGRRITLDRQGNLTGLESAPQYEQAVRAALEREGVSIPAALRELRPRSGTMMGDHQAGFNLIAPSGIVIETDRPTFRWGAFEGAASYSVTVFDSNLTKVISSDPLTATEWTAPVALGRGRTYLWQVRAVKDGQETLAPPPGSSRVKFKVLEQSKAEEIARAKAAHPGSHLIMGILYSGAGLLTDAEREFAELVQANPQSQLAQKLLRSVRAAMR